jgi:hypothetical protein
MNADGSRRRASTRVAEPFLVGLIVHLSFSAIANIVTFPIVV